MNKATDEQKPCLEADGGSGVGDCAKKGIEVFVGEIILTKKEEVEANRVPGCFGEYDPVKYWCADCKDSTECQQIFGKLQMKSGQEESKDDLDDSEPCLSLLCHSCEEGKCIPNETKDDLSCLVEPEPPWTPEYAGEFIPKLSELNSIEDGWKQLNLLMDRLREEYVSNAEKEFDSRLKRVLEGV